MIDERTIEQLLAAFYNGVTTPEEEELLLNFFKDKDLNEKFQADSQLFILLYDSSHIPLPDGFSQRLEKALDEHIANPSQQGLSPSLRGTKQSKIYLRIASVAAVVLLGAGLFFLTGRQDKSQLIADTYSNPEEAAVAVEQALMLVSTKLNQGLAPFEKVKESVNTTNRLLNENFY